MENIRIIVSWFAVLGIPSIFAMTMYCIKACRKFTRQLEILHSAQKAQMRSQLLEQYYVILDRGWVWNTELIEWVNQYTAYHELVGNNEILDARKEELMKFPSKVRI